MLTLTWPQHERLPAFPCMFACMVAMVRSCLNIPLSFSDLCGTLCVISIEGGGGGDTMTHRMHTISLGVIACYSSYRNIYIYIYIYIYIFPISISFSKWNHIFPINIFNDTSPALTITANNNHFNHPYALEVIITCTVRRSALTSGSAHAKETFSCFPLATTIIIGFPLHLIIELITPFPL